MRSRLTVRLVVALGVGADDGVELHVRRAVLLGEVVVHVERPCEMSVVVGKGECRADLHL